MKTLILGLLLSISAFGAEISWYKSYKEAMAQAKAENKPVLVFMSRPGCKSCEFMEDEVLSEQKVNAYINKHYIALHLDVKTNDAPKALQVPVTPVFHFLNSQGKTFKETLFGGKTAPFFIKLIEID